MPLVKSASKEALKKNISTEIRENKPPKQAVAIGYSVQREAKKDKKKEYPLPPSRFQKKD